MLFLYLDNNFIGDIGAKAIATFLQGSKVLHFYIRYNEIGDEGAKALADALPSTELNYFYISNNKTLSSETIAALDKAKIELDKSLESKRITYELILEK